jgi:signal transduction histidine kinase
MNQAERDALLEALAQDRRRIRERVASALHDDICQSITAAGLSLDLLRMDLDPDNAGRVAEVQAILEKAFDRVRLLSHEMHPDPVRRFGFVASLERLVESTRSRFRGTLHPRIEVGQAWDLDRAAAVYEVLEEGIDGIVRYSNAGDIWLTVADGWAELRDNGTRNDQAPPKRAHGNTLMSYHARRAGLSLRVTSTTGSGTIITLR